MPRVNPHLQRRLAARRERVRQRPANSPGYEFATGEEIEAATDAETPAAPPTPRPRVERSSAPLGSTPRAGRAVRTFADYASEYTYVAKDLRRSAIVIGILLVLVVGLALIVRP